MLLVLPADHLITKDEAFVTAVHQAAELALRGHIVTFGIKPDRPETGYGYIARGKGVTVKEFVEKPDRETAEKLSGKRSVSLEQRNVCLYGQCFGGRVADSCAGHCLVHAGSRRQRNH